jgi:hypothetical protein
MKPVLLLSLLAQAACAGASEPPACRGEVFQLNPTRMVSPVALGTVPAATPVGSIVR